MVNTKEPFVSLYGYNSDEPEMFNEIMKNIASYSNTSYLLCGDWNVVPRY